MVSVIQIYILLVFSVELNKFHNFLAKITSHMQ